MRPDLSDNERLLSPDTGGGGEGERIRPGEGEPSTLTSWEQAVDFSQIYSGLARKVGDQHFAYMQVLAPSICLIALKVPRARTFSLKKKIFFHVKLLRASLVERNSRECHPDSPTNLSPEIG